MTNTYSDVILERIHSLLGLMDRNKHSLTYGCCDREHWLHKEKDFPCADKQSFVLTLAILHKKLKGTEFFNNDKIKEWIIAGMRFWAKISDNDGSYSEWYPHEHSYVSTAFSLYAVSEAYLLLKDVHSELIKRAIAKAGKWLLRNDELEVSNQQAVSICSLYNVYLATGMDVFRKGAEKKLRLLEKKQSKEGWFSEYGGADIGYMSVLTDYLAKYYVKSRDKRALEILKRVLEFIKYFITPAGVGGVYSSRNTSFIHPTGFEIIAKYDKNAENISKVLREYVKRNKPNWDERYWMYIGHSYLESEIYKARIGDKIYLPYYKKFEKLFDASGIFIKSNDHFYVIVSIFKDSIKVYDKKRNKVLLSDSGIICTLSDGKIASTNYLNKNMFDLDDKRLVIKGDFHYVNQVRQTIFKMILFRFVIGLIGKSNSLSKILKGILRKILITERKKAPLSFKREVSVGDKIRIDDSVFIRKGVNKMSIGGKFSFLTVPSSSYFEPEDLNIKRDDLNKKEIFQLNDERRFKLTRTLP